MRERNHTAGFRVSITAIVLGVLLLFGPLHARGQPDSIVRIYNVVDTSEGRCRIIGSGTLVDNSPARGIILTCAHLFSEGTGRISIEYPGGRMVGGQLILADRKWDLAAITIPGSGVTPIKIADQYPKPGDSVESSGYGQNGSYRTNRGRVTGYLTTRASQTHETLELTGYAREGDSGGPIVNRRGQLGGVLWGTDGRTVLGTYCGRIKKFLAGVLQRRPSSSGLASNDVQIHSTAAG